MTVQRTNSLASLPIGLDQPSHSFGSKKDDDGFDSALGMAMFAIPPAIATPSQTTNSGRHGSAGSAEASSVDGVSAVDGDRSHSPAQSGGRDAATVDDSVGASSHSAAAITASFENLASQAFAGNSQPAELSSAVHGLALEDGGASIAQSANGQVPRQGQAQAIDRDTSGSTSVTGADAKSFENFAGGAFAGSVEITYRAQAASDSPLSGQVSSTEQPADRQQREIDRATTGPLTVDPSVGDPAASVHSAGALANQDLATEPAGQSPTPGAPRSADGTPAVAPPKSGPIADGTPAFAAPKPGRAPSQSGPAAGKPSQDSVADVTGSATPTSPVRARALYADPAKKPASTASQSRSATAAVKVTAGEDRPAPTVLASPPSAKVAGQQSSASDNPSESATSAAIQDAADGLDGSALAANNKRNLGPRTNSDVAIAHRSGGASADIPAMTGPAEGGGGAPQTTASAAVTLRTFATPASDARIANLRIDLASGQSTQATVREHSGAVDVKIVTSSQQSAQAIGSELPALRRALDAAGVQLKAADVSHQGDGQRGHNGQQQENQSPHNQSGDSTTFAIEEVNQ